MRSTRSTTNSRLALVGTLLVPGGAGFQPAAVMHLTLIGTLLASPGCARIHNHWAEDGPSTVMSAESASAADILATQAPAPQRQREWHSMTLAAADGTVTHGPLYFEDPFEDKGHGRGTFQIGWEDYVAMPYGFARYLLNGITLPVSMAVTWPWTAMESDGVLSRQLLGFDHDAIAAHLARLQERDREQPTAGEP